MNLYLQGKSSKEISEEMGIKRLSVSGMLQKAKEKYQLIQALKKEEARA